MSTGWLAEAPRHSTVSTTIDSALIFSGWLAGSYLLTMLLWVVIPVLVFGWAPMVVKSGSMSPAIDAGDVVLFEAVSEPVGPGTIIAFESRGEVMVHRVVEVGSDGAYTTRGDANAANDSTQVGPEQVLGKGRLLVPHVGLPRVWGWLWWLGAAVISAVLMLSLPRAWRIAVPMLFVISLLAVGAAYSVFLGITASAGNSLTTADVEPPTNLTATCGAAGASDVEVELAWTSSPTAGLAGYDILHDDPSAGTNFVVVGTVGPEATSFIHTVDPVLLGLGDHTYAVRSQVGPWASEMSNTDAVNIVQVITLYVCSEI